MSENHLQYHGTASGVTKVWIKNILLSILTLGLYRAWAKTRMRKYLWAHISMAGDALIYTGTGRELFKGFVKVMLALFLVGLVAGFGTEVYSERTKQPKQELPQEEMYKAMEMCGYTASNWDTLTPQVYETCLSDYEKLKERQTTEGLTNLLTLPFFIYLMFFSRYSALRYRMSRTSWRGIRGRMTGSPHRYAFIAIGRMLLNIVTLGVMIPKSDMAKQAYIMQDMYWGSQKATFNDSTAHLMRTHIITLLLAIPTFGSSRFWYKAALNNTKLGQTSFGTVILAGRYTGFSYMRLVGVNMLLLIFTMGLATPFIIQRTVRYHAANTIVSGRFETSNILQANATSDQIGEAVLAEYDTGIDLDFGFI